MIFLKRSNDNHSRIKIYLASFATTCLLITTFYTRMVDSQPINEDDLAAIPLTQEQVVKSINDTFDKLNDVYVHPNMIIELKEKVLNRLDSGSYSNIHNNLNFSKVISKELQEISGDKHLGVFVNKNSEDPLTHVLAPTKDSIKNNFSFQKAEVLEGNIGLLKFNKFDADPTAQTVTDHAIGFLASTDALIIDLRDCIGGSPELVRYLISHFIGQETLLWTAINRNSAQLPTRSLENIGPDKFKENFPVFILTGPNTTSAAEVFTFVLQQKGIAIVVGEQTPGITHAVSAFRINDYFYGRFSTSWIQFPFAPGGFEGQGVTPDIEVPLDSSLAVAHKAAMAL